MATAKEEEITTRNAQVLNVIRFQSSSMEVLISQYLKHNIALKIAQF